MSEFGLQLREKQKFKLSYGIDERTLRRLFEIAKKRSGSTAEKLLELLERRLDNVVFRVGVAPSRGVARQLIVHGHILVNAEKVRAPGYEVKTGDTIGIRGASQTGPFFSSRKESVKKYEPPSWLVLDREKLEGKVLSLPEGTAPPFEISLVVESFSK